MLNEIIINVIFVSFPLLLYFFYMIYKNMRDEKESNLFLILSLFSSLYLLLKFGTANIDDKLLIFCNVPIVIAYVRDKKILGVILSLFLIGYTCLFIKTDLILVMVIKYSVYFVISILYNKKIKYRLIYIMAIVQGFLLSFEYFYKTKGITDIIEILYIFLVIFLFYVITFSILYLFEMALKISNLYLSYKELEQDKQIKNSLFKLTHEVKNPIAVCKGYLDMFNANDIDKSRKYISIMKQEIDRTLNIMNDFLELNKIRIENEILDLNMLIYDVSDSINLIFSNRNIRLINNINEDEEIYIMGDYNRLKQVLINIFKNSYESIIKEGVIEINSFIKDNKYILEIKDNGIGMDNNTLENIKEAFFTTKKNGNGVGVTLSNEIIKAHGGVLDYISEKDHGTTTIIELPILDIEKEG